jgi:hypothetical protein
VFFLFVSINFTNAAAFIDEQSTSCIKEKILKLTRNDSMKYVKSEIIFRKDDEIKVKLKNGEKISGIISQIKKNEIVIIKKARKQLFLLRS